MASPILGTLDQALRIVDKYQIDDVFLSQSTRGRAELVEPREAMGVVLEGLAGSAGWGAVACPFVADRRDRLVAPFDARLPVMPRNHGEARRPDALHGQR